MEFKRFHCVKKNHVISLRLTEATEWVALVVINPLQCRRRKRCEFGPYIGKTPPEEDMATHSSILSWKIPWTKEPGRLQVVGLQRVEHDWTCRGQVGNWVVVVNQVIIKFPKIMESVVVGHPNFVTISLVTMIKLTSTSWTSSLNSIFSCFSGNSTLMSNKNLKCAQFFPPSPNLLHHSLIYLLMAAP